MKLTRKLKQLWREDKGAIAALVAVFLTGFVGLMGAGIDLGIVYAARGEIQNAADSAAIASAAELLVDYDGDDIVETNYDGAQVAAVDYVTSNRLASTMLSWIETDQFEAGKWDFDTKGFEFTGPSSNPDDLTATRVTLNRTIDTFFARIVGINSVEIQVDSTGFMGYAGDGGKGQLPIVINEKYLNDTGAQPGDELDLDGGSRDEVEWTTYDKPLTSCWVKYLTRYPDQIPRKDIDDTLNMGHGTCYSLIYEAWKAWKANRDGNKEWHIILPVAWWEPNTSTGELKGFIHYVITKVVRKGSNLRIEGYWSDEGQMVAEGAGPGGKNFGVRAGKAALIN